MSTVTFKVKSHYSKFETRVVEIPEDRLTIDMMANLDVIFEFGQNHIQERKIPSVSVGDIIDYYGTEFIVKPIGFEKLEGEVKEVIEASVKYAEENAKSRIEWQSDYSHKMYELLGTKSFEYC